jgi:hypothetical protein
MTMTMKILRVALALLIAAIFVDSIGTDPGAVQYLFSPFGGYKEVVVAGLVAWLVYPMFNVSL